MNKITLRYYARFRGDSGYVESVARSGATGVRKRIKTPIKITRAQSERLTSEGKITPAQENADIFRNGDIRNFDEAAREVLPALMAAGAFDRMSGKELSEAITARSRVKEEESIARSAAMAEFFEKKKEANRELWAESITLDLDTIARLREMAASTPDGKVTLSLHKLNSICNGEN